MFKQEFFEAMKADEELVMLRKKIYSITKRNADIAYSIDRFPTFDEWKAELREKLRKLEEQHGGV